MLDRVEFLELCGTEEAHQHGLCSGAIVGAILLADLAGEHGHAHLLLGMIVIGADLLTPRVRIVVASNFQKL